MNIDAVLATWQPRILSVLRAMTGLLFVSHGIQKLFAFPSSGRDPVELVSFMGGVGSLELIGGILLSVGLFTRSAAFVCSGFAATAYFIGHAGRDFFPILNGGELAIMFCFVFLYLIFAGGGAWSIDALRAKSSEG